MSDQLEVFVTGAISSEDVDACVSVLDEGGALTDVQTAADELPHCLFVVVMRDAAGQVIGVGAVKDQRPQYAAGIASERKSGYKFDPHMHEFGYVVVKESHQGKGHSAQITEKLLSLLPGKPLFATTSNPRMLATLKKYGFTQKGKPGKARRARISVSGSRTDTLSPIASLAGHAESCSNRSNRGTCPRSALSRSEAALFFPNFLVS